MPLHPAAYGMFEVKLSANWSKQVPVQLVASGSTLVPVERGLLPEGMQLNLAARPLPLIVRIFSAFFCIFGSILFLPPPLRPSLFGSADATCKMVTQWIPHFPRRLLRDSWAFGACTHTTSEDDLSEEASDPEPGSDPETDRDAAATEWEAFDWGHAGPHADVASETLTSREGVLFAIKLTGVPLFMSTSNSTSTAAVPEDGTPLSLSDRPDEGSSQWQICAAPRPALMLFASAGGEQVMAAGTGSSDGAGLRLHRDRERTGSQFEVIPDGGRCKIRISDAPLYVAATPSVGAPLTLQAHPPVGHCEWELIPLNLGRRSFQIDDEVDGVRWDLRPAAPPNASPKARRTTRRFATRHKALSPSHRLLGPDSPNLRCHDRFVGQASPTLRMGGRPSPKQRETQEVGLSGPAGQDATGTAVRPAAWPMPKRRGSGSGLEERPAAWSLPQRRGSGSGFDEGGPVETAAAAPPFTSAPPKLPTPFHLPGPAETGVKHWYDPVTQRWHSTPFSFVLDHQPHSHGGAWTAYRLESLAYDGPRCYLAKAAKPPRSHEAQCLDIELQVECQAVADAFNAHRPPKHVAFIQHFLLQCGRAEELLAVEPFPSEPPKGPNGLELGGCPDRHTTQAFAHYSYVHSQGRMLIADMRGVGDRYTDPQVHTRNGQGFGKGNGGRKAILQFFATHQCNTICADLGLPRTNHQPLQSAKTKSREAQGPTAGPPKAPSPNTLRTCRTSGRGGAGPRDQGSPGPSRCMGRAAYALAMRARRRGSGQDLPVRPLMRPEPDAATNDELLTLGLTADQFKFLAAGFRKFTRPDGVVLHSKDFSLFLREIGLFDTEIPVRLRELNGLTHFDGVTFAEFLCWWCGLASGT